MAAVGYGFGGMAALDLARTNCNISGVVSFYGYLNPSNDSSWNEEDIKPKILALHGHNDPYSPPAMVRNKIGKSPRVVSFEKTCALSRCSRLRFRAFTWFNHHY